jgi:hypothetical protein
MPVRTREVRVFGEQGPGVRAELGGRDERGEAAHAIGPVRVTPEDRTALDAAHHSHGGGLREHPGWVGVAW